MSDGETGGSTNTSSGAVGAPSEPPPMPSNSDASSNSGQDDPPPQSTSGTNAPDSTSGEAIGSSTVSPSAATWSSATVSSASPAATGSIAPYSDPVVNNSSDPRWPFNSTIAVPLNWTAPMVRVRQGNFSINPVTGYNTFKPNGGYALTMSYVGVGFRVYGLGEYLPGAVVPAIPEQGQNGSSIDIRGSEQIRLKPGGLTNIMSERRDLALGAYGINFESSGELQLEFHNVTIQVPIKSQA